jgi:subtilase family serine protease
MRHPHTPTTKWFALFVFISAGALTTLAQTNQARSMVTQPVNESQMLVLKGNIHPLARTEFDRGPAPATLPMENIQLVLKRSPEQEAALEELLREQQDPSSPNYHKGVTPQEFGARFGASDHDIQAVTSWLKSHGLLVVEVSPGRNIIQFSGTAAEVESALRTSIHSYVVKGEQHWANATEPQIPAALGDVVAGVNTLHNFHRKPMSRKIGTFSRSSATGEVKPLHPQFSFDIGQACTGIQPTGCFAVAPFDFATIYNVLPLWNAGIDGTGETIAIVGDSNINPADVTNFRSLFGLPANAPHVIIADNGTDPGIQPPPNGDELESDLDIQWAGAVAKGATIDFVIAANTNSTNGVDLAAEHIINHNLAPVMSESFGDCELDLGSAGNQFFNSLWQMGAAEMITIVVSTGDNGAAACDFPNSNTNDAMPVSNGQQVSGIASTPFNVAVGGTDFDELSSPTSFWSTTNAQTTQLSAKGYIPETTWNDSCTNLDFIIVGFNPLPEENCNSTAATLASSINPIGAGGGVSNCTAPTGNTPSGCAGGYAKPAFQSAPGVPNDGKRDLPDVSLFAGDGLVGSFYVICEQDINTPSTNNPCSLANPNNDTVGVGGTSASTQAFAGVMALVVQKTGSRQGIGAATAMYQLAAQQSQTGCLSSGPPASTCVFNDVTKGTISQPCVKNSTNCVVATSTDANGVLSGCDAAPGFDLATGLGSINADNLVNNFTNGAGAGSADFALSLANCTSTIIISSPGGSGSFTAVVTELNGFNSAVTFTCAPMPSEATCAVTTTNIDATHISAKVAVTTTAASRMVPAGPSANNRGFWIQRNPIVLALILSAAIIIFLIGASAKNRRLTVAMAFVALSTVVMTMAACSGGGGGGGGGGNAGTPTGVSSPTLTATGGSTTHTLNFTLIVE